MTMIRIEIVVLLIGVVIPVAFSERLDKSALANSWKRSLNDVALEKLYTKSLIAGFDADENHALSLDELTALLSHIFPTEYATITRATTTTPSSVEMVPRPEIGEYKVHVQNGEIETENDVLEKCSEPNWKNNSVCLTQKCLNLDEIWMLFQGRRSLNMDTTALQRILPAVIYQRVNKNCASNNASNKLVTDEMKDHERPSMSQVWGYALGFVTLINVISNIGALMIPIMEKTYFKRVLMFMLALAVGSMCGTSIFVLIPEAYDLMNNPYTRYDYIWKSLTVIVTIYCFFLIERILSIATEYRKEKNKWRKEKKRRKYIQAEMLKATENQQEPLTIEVCLADGSNENYDVVNNIMSHERVDDGHGHSHGVVVDQHGNRKEGVAAVAWMMLTGDGLHKCMDGLAIGAGFSESVLLGLSISIAILCEEVPHELGDIAILLHSGLTIKRALIYNCIAALFSYAGLLIGVLLGENTSANRWIFAMAGGMFLYVSLVDLLPEINRDAQTAETKSDGACKIFIIQNLGLIIGLALVFFMANYIGVLTNI